MTAVIVTFGKLGAHPPVPPVRIGDATLTDPRKVEILHETIRDHLRNHVFARDFYVILDPDHHTGSIKLSNRVLGKFTLREVDE